ncbi:MAG: CaiB/BaiF CoA transferase family protein [Bacillota bacterium]
MKVLDHITVVDLTRFLAGPLCAMFLADFGAEVIKIEAPGRGDDTRSYSPFVSGESAYFMSINRNKKSITLNLKSEEGKEILKKLIDRADVLLENFTPGTMEKLGLGYEQVREINPSIIYASCSGFGSTGPYAGKPAYDAVMQGIGGIMSVTGQPGGLPTRVGVSIADITAGYFMTIGVLTALVHRERTGRGQMVENNLLDCQLALLENPVARYFATGQCPQPSGNRHPSIAPYSAYATRDGYMIVAAGNDKHWEVFCRAVGREDLLEDERFKTNALRVKNYSGLEPIMNDILREKTTAEWIEILESHNMPCGPINTIEQIVNDAHVRARGIIWEIDHPVAGKIKVTGNPIYMSETPAAVKSPPPVLGGHTEEILSGMLNYTDDEIKALREKKVI